VFVRLDCKSLQITNTLAYYGNLYFTDKKSFITLGPGLKDSLGPNALAYYDHYEDKKFNNIDHQEKWDQFLTEIGRLSIEIDDDNETFI
jgi:hypothetical protein